MRFNVIKNAHSYLHIKVSNVTKNDRNGKAKNPLLNKKIRTDKNVLLYPLGGTLAIERPCIIPFLDSRFESRPFKYPN